MRIGFRLKLVCFTFCIVLLVGGGISLYSNMLGRQWAVAAFENDAREITSMISRTIANDIYFLDFRSLRLRLENARVNPTVLQTYVMDLKGAVLSDGTEENRLRDQTLSDPFSRDILRAPDWISAKEGRILRVGGPVVMPDGQTIGYLSVEFSGAPTYRIIEEMTRSSVSLTLICLAVGGALAFIVASSASRPIISLANAAREIGEGKLDTRVAAKRHDELGMLAASINQMALNLATTTVSKAYADNLLRITQSMIDSLIVLNVDWTIRAVNPATLKLLEYEEYELIGHPLALVIPGWLSTQTEEIEDLFDKGAIRTFDTHYVTKGGRRIPVSFSISVMRDDLGGTRGIVCVAQDISQRKRAEETRQALYQASLRIQEALETRERLTRFLKAAQDLLHLERMNILVADAAGQWLQAAASTETEEELEAIRVPIGPEGGALAQAYLARQVIVWYSQGPVPEAYRLKPPYDRIAAFRSRSFIIVPLIVQGRAIGVLGADRKRSRQPFEPDTVELLQLFAAQAAIAIENARLYAEAVEKTQRLEGLSRTSANLAGTLRLEEVLHTIAEEAAKLLRVEGAGFRLLEGDQLVVGGKYGLAHHVMLKPSLRVGESLTGLVAQVGRPLSVPDLREDRFYLPEHKVGAETHGVVAYLGVPLRWRDRIIGVLNVYGRKQRTFDEGEVNLLSAFADQAAIAIENARLFDDVGRERGRLEVLYDVSRRLALVHETDQVLAFVVQEATRLLGLEAAAIRLLEGEDLVLAARTEPAAALTFRSRLKVGEGLGGLVVATGEPVAVEDLAEDTRYDPAHKARALARGFHGFLGVPLRADGQTIGVLNLYTKAPRRFLPEEISLLAAFADQASLAIERGRHLRETRQLYELTTQLASSLDLERLLDSITAKTLELLKCEATGIYIYDEVKGGLVFRRALHLDPELAQELVLKPGEGIAGRAFQERRPHWTADRLADPSLQYTPGTDALIREKAPRAYLAAPIVSRGRVHGVLMDYFFGPHEYTSREIELLSTLAAQAAIAMENTRLYHETVAQKTQLTQIFDSTSDGIILVGTHGRIEAANRRAGELLGVASQNIVGLGLADLVSGHFDAVSEYGRAVTAFKLSLLEDQNGIKEGDLVLPSARRVLHWTAQPTRDSAGYPVGLTLTFRDVTREREADQMKTDFVSFATHQLRTPLAGIKWMLELAAQEPGLPEEAGSFIQDARASADRLIGLVNDLLDVSRLERGKITFAPQAIRLEELTRSVLEEVNLLIQEKRHRLSVSGGEELPPVVADPQLLRQVLLNLVSNAIKYTLPGGEIAIHMTREGEAVQWAIQDSGVGIPKAAQARLFEKFYRADNVVTIETEGTGLGLYLVRLIVERCGGKIWCDSEEGHGSTFSFTLPLNAK